MYRRLVQHGAMFRSIRIAALATTAICGLIYFQYGFSTLTALSWFKLVTTSIFIYFVYYLHRDQQYYYHNLGISASRLIISAIIIDLSLFAGILYSVHLFNR